MSTVIELVLPAKQSKKDSSAMTLSRPLYEPSTPLCFGWATPFRKGDCVRDWDATSGSVAAMHRGIQLW
jgi:hypothetical protein